MSAEMMLHYLADQHEDKHSEQCALRIRTAYEGALDNGEKTRDLGGELSTEQFAQAVIARL